jgi:hypothetical protein
MADDRKPGTAGPGTNDTTEYSPSRAPETREHAEERDAEVKDPRLIPGGIGGARTGTGMETLDRDVVPSGGSDLELTDYGHVDETSRPEND